MYTGITQGTCPVTAVDYGLTNLSLEIELGALSEGLEIGASVSIDGVCQTVVGIDGGRVRFEVIRESLERSTLDELAVGRRVSVERSARIGDEIGGHEIAGHVSGTGRVRAVERDGTECALAIEVPRAWRKWILEKGFIAVDGSSLTIGRVIDSEEGCCFRVHLIPETMRRTGLGRKRVGDRVNIELDARTVAIVETVERSLRPH
jgi:riboflavin synthase